MSRVAAFAVVLAALSALVGCVGQAVDDDADENVGVAAERLGGDRSNPVWFSDVTSVESIPVRGRAR